MYEIGLQIVAKRNIIIVRQKNEKARKRGVVFEKN